MRRIAIFAVTCALALACRSPADWPAESAVSIAVEPFALAAGSPAPPIDVAEVIRTRLASSGRFVVEEQRGEPDYRVTGRVAMVHDGGHEVEFHLVDTRVRSTLVEFLVPSAPDALERTALEIAAIIDRRLAHAPRLSRYARAAPAKGRISL